MKVLVVESDEDVRLVTSLSLKLIGGLSVVEAENPGQILGIALAESPDLVLMEISQENQELTEQALSCLRSTPETASLPVVLLSTNSVLHSEEQLKKIGASGVLMKPFDPATLASQLKLLINTSAPAQKNPESIDFIVN